MHYFKLRIFGGEERLEWDAALNIYYLKRRQTRSLVNNLLYLARIPNPGYILE